MKKIFLILFPCLFSCIDSNDPKLEINYPAPEIKTRLIDGSDFTLTQLKGKYVLIDFWGSWCGPCHKEGPELVALYEKYSNEKFNDADGFEIVSIALEKNDKNWRKVSEHFGYNWPNQIVEISTFVRFSELAKAYSVTDIPAKFLIGPDGNLLAKQTNFSVVEEVLSAKVAQ